MEHSGALYIATMRWKISAPKSRDPGNDVNLEMIFLDQHKVTQKHYISLYSPHDNDKKVHSFN